MSESAMSSGPDSCAVHWRILRRDSYRVYAALVACYLCAGCQSEEAHPELSSAGDFHRRNAAPSVSETSEDREAGQANPPIRFKSNAVEAKLTFGSVAASALLPANDQRYVIRSTERPWWLEMGLLTHGLNVADADGNLLLDTDVVYRIRRHVLLDLHWGGVLKLDGIGEMSYEDLIRLFDARCDDFDSIVIRPGKSGGPEIRAVIAALGEWCRATRKSLLITSTTNGAGPVYIEVIVDSTRVQK